MGEGEIERRGDAGTRRRGDAATRRWWLYHSITPLLDHSIAPSLICVHSRSFPADSTSRFQQLCHEGDVGVAVDAFESVVRDVQILPHDEDPVPGYERRNR